MLGYSQLDRIHVIFVNEAKYQRNVHRCHIMFVRQTNQYLKDKRKSFTLQFTPCQFRSHIPSVMPRKSSIRVLSGIDDAFHKRRNCSHQCGCTIRNDFTLSYMKRFKKFLDENSLNADKHNIDSAIMLLSGRVFGLIITNFNL